MKNFFVLLSKGVGIALAISFSICFFAWNWGNWRAIIWFIVGVIMVWQICKYLLSDIKVAPIYDDDGKVLVAEHSASVIEKSTSIALCLFIITLLAGFLWGIGRLAECLLNQPSKIFEFTILFGLIMLLLVFTSLCLLASIYFSIKTACWKLSGKVSLSIAKWILVIVISCLVAFGVLYFYLPPMS